jgi:copper transport protein
MPPSPRFGALSGVLALVAVLVAPAVPGSEDGRVAAHAQLVASSPGAGAVVPSSPEELRLVFGEPLEAQATSLDVVDERGSAIISRGGEVDPDDPFALVVRSPGLVKGTYTVTWRTLSAADGHTAEGFFSFAVGEDSPAPLHPASTTHAEPDPVHLIGRWLTYLGLMLAFGGAVIVRIVLRTPMPRALAQVLAGALAVSAVATLVMAVVNGLDAGSVPEYLFGTRNGGLQLGRGAVAALTAAGLLFLPRALGGLVAGLGGLAGIGLLIAAGHAAAVAGTTAMLTGVVHVATAGTWVAGIAMLLVSVVRPALLFDDDRPGTSTLVPRFSALALVSIGLLAVTGAHAAWVQTGGLPDPATDYGRALVTKSVLAGVALALGGINYLDGGRMRSWLVGMRGRLTVEVVAAAAVLAVTAVLATTPPTEEAPGVPIAPVPDAFGRLAPDTALTLTPGRPGVNRVTVTTTDAMAMTSGSLALGLDRLDTGSTTLVPLTLADGGGMDHGGMGGMEAVGDGTVDWTADAVVLAAESRWDASVRIMSSAGTELSRQRFSFALSQTGVADGRAEGPLDAVLVIGGLLGLGGVVGLGIGLGGGRLPRCDERASRWALTVGGMVAAVVGAAIGLERLVLG